MSDVDPANTSVSFGKVFLGALTAVAVWLSLIVAPAFEFEPRNAALSSEISNSSSVQISAPGAQPLSPLTLLPEGPFE
jgi:hypothetical protein